MEEKLVTFKTAKLAKEKGFNLEVYDYYYNKKLKCDSVGYGKDDGVNNHKDLRGNYNHVNKKWLKTLIYHYDSIKDLSLNEIKILWKNEEIKDASKEIKEKKVNLDNYLGQCSAPTQSLLQKWLREKYNLHIIITLECYCDGINYCIQILCYDKNNPDGYNNDKCTRTYGDNGEFKTYEDALEFALQKALNFIKL